MRNDFPEIWMTTYQGGRFPIHAPQPEDIHILDIAHALSQLCRYGGNTLRFYSVAEHSVLLSRVVAPEHALWALLHDASEAYVGDVIQPLKRALLSYQLIEGNVMSAVTRKFGLSRQEPAEVKTADTSILINEHRSLMKGCKKFDLPGYSPLPVRIEGWPPGLAKRRFLEAFRKLTR